MKSSDENPSAAPMMEWWDIETLSETQSKFRRILKQRRPDVSEVWHTWMRFFAVSNIRGLTRPAANCLALLVEKARREHCQVEKALSREALGGLTRMTFRALLALAEQPDVPASTVHHVAAVVDGLFLEDGCYPADRAVLRLALTSRLALPVDACDIALLQEAWKGFLVRKAEFLRVKDTKKIHQPPNADHEEDDDEESEKVTQLKAVCPAAAGQTLTTALLQCGRQEEAFNVAAQVLDQNPCIGPCGIAPQGVLSAVLLPLQLAGRQELAADYAARLARLAPISHAWLEPAAARIAYLSHCDRHTDAIEMIRQASEFASDRDSSAWHRLQFHRAAYECLKCTGNPDLALEASEHEMEALRIQAAFDTRNETITPRNESI